MKIKPHELLKYLGFDIPEEGVDVNDVDAFFHTESLSLLGKTISTESITDEQLASLRNGMVGVVAAHGVTASPQITDQELLRLRALIKANLEMTYKHSG